MVIVFLGTGLRVGELTGLTWDDVDFEENTITVSKTLTYYNDQKSGGLKFRFHDPKTFCGRRTIPMSATVKSALLAEKEKQESKHICCKIDVDGINNFCFLTRQKRPYPVSAINTSLNNIVKAYNESFGNSTTEVKLPHISCHNFRHSFATRMFEAGTEPKIIQEILGHSSISITLDIYTDVFASLKKRDIDAIDSFLSAS